MKKLVKITSYLFAISLIVASCGSDEKIIDEVFDGVSNGAVLRTVNIVQNEFTFPSSPDAGIEIELEEQDNQDGALLDKVELYMQFFDNSENASSSNVLVETIQSDQFEDGPFGLPRYTIAYSQAEVMSIFSLTDDDISGGDKFTTNLILYLTDGRIFDVNNAGGIITGGFFASPFQYITNVVCPVPESAFTGDYLMEQISPYIDGPTLSDGAVVTLEAEGTKRIFQTQNYPDYCGSFYPFTIDLLCGEIAIPTQSNACVCGDGTDWFTDPETRETFDVEDDSVFIITFTDDTQSDCGAPAETTYQFTKQ